MIGPAEFINRVFWQGGGAICITHPDSFVNNAGKTVNYFRNYTYREALFTKTNSWYVCVSTVTAVPRGQKLTRKIEDLQEAMVLVLDDVGTKSAVPPVEPSYILETSEGNYQYGYILAPWDVSTPEGYALYDGSLRALANAGYNDPGAIGGYRAVRVPGSLHKTGWVCRCTLWEPDRVWGLLDLMEQMDVVPIKQRVNRSVQNHTDPNASTGIPADDPVFKWLYENGHVLDDTAPEWQVIRCPWHGNHSDSEDITAYYSPTKHAFCCHHATCRSKKTRQMIEWATAAGLPSLQSTAPINSPYRQIREYLYAIK